MSKIIIIPNNKDCIESILNTDNYLLLGIEGYSINTFNLEYDELIKYVDRSNNIFLSLNKNISNDKVEDLEKLLIDISKLNIKGLFYYDVSIVSIVNRLNLNINLVWSSEHYTTNYFTINYWNNYGVKSVFLSNEITVDEIQDIKNNTSVELIGQLFGYIPMYASKRHAVKNYLNHFNLDLNSNKYYLFKEDKKYSIVDNNDGTVIYSNFILNGLREYLNLNNVLDYVLINGYDIETDKLLNVVNIFSKVNKDNINVLDKEIMIMFDNLEKGFLHEETIYRVKRDK
jgi:collagenase-like PrtC family protease